LSTSGLFKKSEETINHLLIHCEFSRELWHLVLIFFWNLVGHAGHCFRVTSLLEDARAVTIQRGHLESHSFFTYVDYLERKK
jgi:hypothetical protein